MKSMPIIYCLVTETRVCNLLTVTLECESPKQTSTLISFNHITAGPRLSTVGDRAFPVAAASTWNDLPDHVNDLPHHLCLFSEAV